MAQETPFGSSDDPREQIQRVWWQYDTVLDVRGGLSLIASELRAASSIELNAATRGVLARLAGTIRAGYGGEYHPDVDEPYDLLRLIHFIRYNAPPQSNFYLRAGPIDRLSLGDGHVVNFFDSDVAWDERTVGLQAQWESDVLTLSGFTDNVLLGGVVGAHAALSPFAPAADARLRSLTLGVSYARDTDHLPAAQDLIGYDAALSFALIRSGDVTVYPLAGYARYQRYGQGVSLGAGLGSLNFIDLARFWLRMALYLNDDQFLPGYFGSFYPVSNAHARLLNSDEYLVDDGSDSLGVRIRGITLDEARRHMALLTELRLLVFDQIEFWYYFRRHYAGQSLSELHLRLFLRSADLFQVSFGLDRGGLDSFFSLFSEAGDQTALVFAVDYQLLRGVYASIRSRYTYELIDRAIDGTRYFLVQRRFEPFLGLRLRL